MICISAIVISLVILSADYNKPNQPSLYLNWIVSSAKPINQTELTSLVTNTQNNPNGILLHLTNGMVLQSNDTSIKSGDSMAMTILIYKPICSLSMNTNNHTITNGTSMILKITKDPRCEQGYEAIQILDWHKLNQK